MCCVFLMSQPERAPGYNAECERGLGVEVVLIGSGIGFPPGESLAEDHGLEAYVTNEMCTQV